LGSLPKGLVRPRRPWWRVRAAISKRLNDGVGFLMKNKVTVIWGDASIDAPGKVP
jgi:pyruvate/2-oxoglutarate dehydrogenase complex dihydrolipoamide dehydrogenase (E3) component